MKYVTIPVDKPEPGAKFHCHVFKDLKDIRYVPGPEHPIHDVFTNEDGTELYIITRYRSAVNVTEPL
jgi:hypothetical protein